ncbi:regulator of microtubule dynamics protein 1 [Plutella xylostella]|uniref:regulator of microtubule dynamics protein 1 n=1 Tax=Plutella xylostella TaxID=51655 RepID=UPI00203307C1|nr:regulator of microtubule dynamics protein 1 [Plutella xylostella]
MNFHRMIIPIAFHFARRASYYSRKSISRRHNILFPPVLTALAFFWPIKSKQSIEGSQKNQSQTILAEADKLFENGHYEQCYQLLSSDGVDNDVEIQWRICRVLYNMSKDPKANENSKKSLIARAYLVISGILEDNYNHFAVQKWYALLLDAKSANDGIKERIKQLETVKKHMDLAVTLNPKDATTLHMLGEWCYQLAEMPWHHRKIASALFASPPTSTYEDALEYFLQAESVEPRFYSVNLVRIGNCYLKMKKEDQAKYYLQLAATYPAKSNDDHQANKEAAELLNKYFKHSK